MSENSRGVYGGARHSVAGGGYIRNSFPAADGPHKFGTSHSLPSGHANPGGPRPPSSKSWQARNRWYSKTIVAITFGVSAGTLIVLLLMEIAK